MEDKDIKRVAIFLERSRQWLERALDIHNKTKPAKKKKSKKKKAKNAGNNATV